MNVPLEIIVAGMAGVFTIAGAVIAFVFKVVFGLIVKNEMKSDEADVRIEQSVLALSTKSTNNDRELYQKLSDAMILIARLQSQIDCIKGAK
jgi:hypothetical protein